MIEQVEAGEHVILTSCLQIKHHNFFFGILIYECEEKAKNGSKCAQARITVFFSHVI